MNVVSIGGGTGQSQLLRALRNIQCSITAVVSMADDGGSTGLLRKADSVPAVGDIRKCLLALSQNEGGLFEQSLAFRMPAVDNHVVGNLVLYGLYKQHNDLSQAISAMQELLGCVGDVLPITSTPITLGATLRDGTQIFGQAHITASVSPVRSISIEPQNVSVNPLVLNRIENADALIFGPGSLFTSIVSCLLFPEVVQAIQKSCAKKIFVCPMADSQGETKGMRAHEYVATLEEYGLKNELDCILFHREWPEREGCFDRKFSPIELDDVHLKNLQDRGIRIITENFSSSGKYYVHDIIALSRALKEVLS